MNINSNIINRYDDLLYENRPATLNEYINNKYNIVHNELYNSALNKYIHSLVDKYISSQFIYEFYKLMSKIESYNENYIIWEDIYNRIFLNEENTPIINNMLNDLSIDRSILFKLLYDSTIDKLNKVKTKIVNFYRDDNYDLISIIKGITEISNIKDFRIAYTISNISAIGSESNNENNVFTLYIGEDNELTVSNKVVFYSNDNDNNTEYLNNLYYYIGKNIPLETADIYNDNNWYNINNTNVININEPIYYIVIPSICGIYKYNEDTNTDEQINGNYSSIYTFVKSIIINNMSYNIYITTNTNNIFNDKIKVNDKSVYTYTDADFNDFDLICSENNEYIMLLYDYDTDIRIGYDANGKWLLIINDEHPIDNDVIKNVEKIIKHYMNYESNNISDEYKNIVCNLYKKYHKIIEIKNSEYWMPSSIRIINRVPPYTKVNVDLTKYWNMIQSNNDSKLTDLKITNENILDSELIELNYINGKAKIQSRINDTIYEVPFKYLDESVDVSDEMILSNSFINKYNNL